jgi:hypothetical protein
MDNRALNTGSYSPTRSYLDPITPPSLYHFLVCHSAVAPHLVYLFPVYLGLPYLPLVCPFLVYLLLVYRLPLHSRISFSFFVDKEAGL